MIRKIAVFNEGTANEGKVAYVISKDKIVYFTQVSGRQSSINAGEKIVEAISKKERLNWQEYRWVDLQTRVIYPDFCEDELIFEGSDTPIINHWQAAEVPVNIFQALLIDRSE